AHQDQGARNQAAAEDPVQFPDPRIHPIFPAPLHLGDGCSRRGPAPDPCTARCAGGDFPLFDHGIPGTTTGASPHPFGGSISAFLTSIRGLRHRQSSSPRFPAVCCLHYIAKSLALITVPSLPHRIQGIRGGVIGRRRQWRISEAEVEEFRHAPAFATQKPQDAAHAGFDEPEHPPGDRGGGGRTAASTLDERTLRFRSPGPAIPSDRDHSAVITSWINEGFSARSATRMLARTLSRSEERRVGEGLGAASAG